MTHTSSSRPVALVTGGRRGIGRGICLALAKGGFDLVVNDLEHDQAMDGTLAQLTGLGARACAVIADISIGPDRERLVKEAWSAFGGIECLVNNAGISVQLRGDILDVTEESFDRLVDVNLKGMFFLTQAMARAMLAEPSGGRGERSIINISSANAVFVSLDRAEYCISKAGISMASRLYAVRLAEVGIRVYEIRPGIIESDMTQVARAKYDRLIADGLTPIARIGVPADVGEAVTALARRSFPFNTGEAFHVDGGLHIQRL